MAFTKQEKKELVAKYETWLKDCRAVYVLTYHKMRKHDIDALRADAREIGGEFHVVKNTLMNLALKSVGWEDTNLFDQSSMLAIAFEDAPAMAKLVDKAGSTDLFAIKGGYMDGAPLDASSVVMLAKLPSAEQVRAQLLALIQTPATRLARTLAEPARMLAAVMQARVDQNPAPAAG